ncbi:MAG: hypothetical protein NTY16_11085 [Deltaproteobacteria bacterium]|nr:hypothetical protein [Deltaproteobacteria bacterium]
MKIDEGTRKAVQGHLGYTDEEMEIFMKNPRNWDVLSKAPALLSKTVVVEVVEASGCNSQHKVGDRFIFDGAGNLLTKLNPPKICCFALSPLLPLFHAAGELLYAGVDPNEMRFKRTGCFDTGIKCGGWGHIVMEIRVEDRKKP